MVSLTIDNSICSIYGLNVNQYADLRKLLSYTADPAQGRYSGWKGNNRRYLLDKKGNFPTGLLYLVEQYFEGQTMLVHDKRIKPVSRPGMFSIRL